MTAASSDTALRQWLYDYLITTVGCDPDKIDFDASMSDLGVGSRDAVVLSGELSELLDRPVSPVEFWQHPTVNALIAYLTMPESESQAGKADSADRRRADEPIAVIGLGCRFPGGIFGPEALWQFLCEGRSAVGEVPPDRWPPFDNGSAEVEAALSETTRWGSFLADIDAFDAEFFEISPREATEMDPQQRLLLEVTHEALEHAGITAESLRRTLTGVFAGACAGDYGYLATADLSQVDAWSGTGAALSIIANRVSYFFDLRGPSVTVDTACSSSLVAAHLACQSLREGDSNLAIVAGVNLLLSPAITRSFDSAEAMSPTGACHAFDASADGFVRGEGCGVAVLKRLADAVRDGDRVLAVVRGSAVNQDGRSNGLMAPNPAAQMAVLRAAYANAGVSPHEVDYVEAHGTGTLLGDPIEARALGTVLGQSRPPGDPLLIGAVKSNLGHLEAAAGIAGLIKAVLAVQHGRIPANLHFENPNPHIPFEELGLKVVAEPTDWPSNGHPRRAGVSSFGFGGTNAHIVLEQGPDPSVTATVPPSGSAVTTLVVSGKTDKRVAATAGVLAEWMEADGADVELPEVAHTLNHHRSRQAKFATVAAVDRVRAVAGLRALAAGQSADGVVAPHQGVCRSGTVFVYSGQGSQWAGMGRQLLADEPAFAAAVAGLESVFVEQVGFSLQQVLAGGEPVVGIDRIQPVLVGVQLALTELWRSYGVVPDAVIGHSMGEVAAAVVAEALSPAEGLRVIATRSRLMSRLSGQGAMALLELDPDAAEALIADYAGVTLAVYASPRQSVIAGPPEQVDAVIAVVGGQDRLARRIEVDVASHHPIIDPVLPELREALADLAPRSPGIPVLTTTGAPPVFDADYWAANLRNPVRFGQAVAAAGADHGTFIEVSPHPLLTYAIDDTLAETHHHSVGTLQRDSHDTVTFHTNLNATHTVHPPDTDHPPEPHPVIPTTPWHHDRHWLSAPSTTPVAGHPLLGVGVTDPTNGTRVWQRTLSADFLWLGDHRVDDMCVLPATAYVELALAAVTEAFGAGSDKPWMISELCLHQVLPVGDATVVVTTLSGDESGPRVEIRSGSSDSGWTLHAGATLERTMSEWAGVVEPFEVDEASASGLDAEDLYQRLRNAGQQHGPAFQGIVGLTGFDDGAARSEVRLPSAARQGSRRFLAHPVMVDIALQTLGATKVAAGLGGDDGTAPGIVLPVRLAGVRVYGDVTEGVCALGTLATTSTADRFVGRVRLIGGQGQVLLDIDEIDMVALRPGPGNELAGHMFTLDWEQVDLEKPAGDVGAVLLIGDHTDGDALFSAVQSGLSQHTADCHVVPSGDAAQLRGALTRKDVSWNAIVVACPPRRVDEALSDSGQLDLAQSRTLLIADIVKTLSRVGARNSPRLWIVTRGAQQVAGAEPVTLAQTALRGLARVLTFEHPELKTTVVDLDADGGGSADALVHELCADTSHDEVALRDGRRYVHRLVRLPVSADGVLPAEPRPVVVDLAGGDAVRLQADAPGRLDALTLRAVRRTPLADDHVEVRVVAAGLNFSDVLKAMGLYPTLDGSAPVIGSECVGYVTGRGAEVDSVQLGQRVIAFGPGAFGSHLTTSADLVVPVPEELSDREAATVGLAYLTAWYALCEVARLAPGERVLIHSATGGVGLAAVSIAKMIGARIYTTAGSPAKRERLVGLGVEYVGDSRSLKFADEIHAATDGQGVDVIVNSLAGDAIRRGVEILAAGGRFVELGKRDVYADAQLGLASLAKSGSFAVVDLDLNLRLQPQRYHQLLQEILQRVVGGQLELPPVTEFSLDNAVDAFRLMASGAHIGKIVISVPAQGRLAAVASPPAQPLVRADGGYIVVGGMGGLGFVAARWLAAQGAGMIVLNGRSAPSTEVAAAIAEINAAGSTRVEVVTGDIAEPRTAVQLVAAIEEAGLRPAGVLHSAMVLVDEIVLNMSTSALARVFSPKVMGHWWLHEATANHDLDWWLTFSSAASLLGSPGQGAYAAANSWVDGLVAYRRSRGLPASGINWGPWAEVGRAQFFADLGFSMITSQLGLAAMQQVLAADRCRTGVFSLDARQWFQSFPTAEGSSLFAGLAESAAPTRRGGGRLRAELDAAEPEERAALLAAAIATEIQGVRRSTEPLNHDQPMESLGLDSLMALELRNRLEAVLGITLPVALVWAYPNISALAGALSERMGYQPITESGVTAEADAQVPLSDEEADLLADFVDASELEVKTGAAEL